MTSPAERYAAYRAEKKRQGSQYASFSSRFPFPLDDFQRAGCESLEAGNSVLVAAPTGAGKTVVGEFAVHLALSRGQKVFYTAPIKALSNQKFQELVEWLGAQKVGLLTGDTSVRPDADVVVMTTEVLRNMLYANSSMLHGLGFVVMDEVHYLADRLRGPVWEEVIIHLAASVQLVALSATVSNAEEFGAWINEIRPTTSVVVSEKRPVPLWQHVMVGDHLHDLFVDEDGNAVASHGPGSHGQRRVNPDVHRFAASASSVSSQNRAGSRHAPRQIADAQGSTRGGSRQDRRRRDRRGTGGRHRPRGGYREAPWTSESSAHVSRREWNDHERTRGRRDTRGNDARPRMGGRNLQRPHILTELDREGLLPAIFFIFSRAGCDAAVRQCGQARLTLTTPEEQRAIRWILDEHLESIGVEDEIVLNIPGFRRAAINGYGAHHAGMIPLLKTVVEELFTQGLMKCVFATETLALGINMPARSVVLEKLVKFNGIEHADLTPGEFTQLTGRAGRRGIDTEGHAIVLTSGKFDPESIARLASTRTYPLRSAFRPTPNMAVNLLGRFTLEEARETLDMSFAQFQADRSVVGMARRLKELEDTAESYSSALTCDAGDFHEYAQILDKISGREKELSQRRATHDRERTRAVIRNLQRGQIIALPGGRRQGFGVVLDVDRGALGGPRITILTAQGRIKEVATHELTSSPAVIDSMRLPKPSRMSSAKIRKDTGAALRQKLSGHSTDPRDAVRQVTPKKASTAATDESLNLWRQELRAHPCHGCPEKDAHMRWLHRLRAVEKDIRKTETRIHGRTALLTTQFDHLVELLVELGYLAYAQGGGQSATVAPTDIVPTESGHRLARLFSDRDLLIAECLRDGAWNGLSPASFAAILSTCTYEARREDSGSPEIPPDSAFDRAFQRTVELSTQLRVAEHRARVELTAEPDAGIAAVMYRWASGQHFAAAVSDSGLPPGDFVRQCRQVIDLLTQLVHDSDVGTVAREAIDAIRRGLVAQELGSAA